MPTPQFVSKETKFLRSFKTCQRLREYKGITDKPVVFEKHLVSYDPLKRFPRDALE